MMNFTSYTRAAYYGWRRSLRGFRSGRFDGPAGHFNVLRGPLRRAVFASLETDGREPLAERLAVFKTMKRPEPELPAA